MEVQLFKVPSYGFKIKNKETAEIFLSEALQEGHYTIQDVNNKMMYYSLFKDAEGKVTMGHTAYGNGIVPPIFADDINLVGRVFNARKSLNEHFFSDI